jgi:catechol 2,3-dioxygenase-like lactoylglutathione lyase family enzyme
VADPRRSVRFYQAVFGVTPYVEDADEIQVLGPGPHDVLVFTRAQGLTGEAGPIRHFGFRLVDAADIDDAVQTVLEAGGTLVRRGVFKPGYPYAFVRDPDGHEIEIWFE